MGETQRRIDVADLADLALGARLLGSGGGGRTSTGAAFAHAALRDRGPVRLLGTRDLPDDHTVVAVGVAGSSAFIEERLPSTELATAVRTLLDLLDRPPFALLPLEIGGVNALLAVAAASMLDAPLLDADAMGRAFPRVEQTSLTASGVAVAPAVLAVPDGTTLTVRGEDNLRVAGLIGANLPALGGWAATALYPCRADVARTAAIPGSVSRALALGRSLREAGADPHDRPRFAASIGAEWLFDGVVAEVLRPDRAAPHLVVTLESALPRQETLRLDAGDEFLLAALDGRQVARVPDVIAVLSAREWSVLGVDALRPRQPVSVLRIPRPPIWDRLAAGDLVGPGAHELGSLDTVAGPS
ncbi:DUF917 domain-containing protein [Marinactinospora thermotolerans]|nr:DUF917 domain-containing protein [Marinactinospora thermotolerans]